MREFRPTCEDDTVGVPGIGLRGVLRQPMEPDPGNTGGGNGYSGISDRATPILPEEPA